MEIYELDEDTRRIGAIGWIRWFDQLDRQATPEEIRDGVAWGAISPSYALAYLEKHK